MRLALVFLLTTLVATCGQKGPLELPAPTDSAVSARLPGTLGPQQAL